MASTRSKTAYQLATETQTRKQADFQASPDRSSEFLHNVPSTSREVTPIRKGCTQQYPDHKMWVIFYNKELDRLDKKLSSFQCMPSSLLTAAQPAVDLVSSFTYNRRPENSISKQKSRCEVLGAQAIPELRKLQSKLFGSILSRHNDN